MTIIDSADLAYRRAVRDRLDTWMRTNYASRAAFQRETGLDMSALRRCLNSTDPQLPSGAILGTLGARTTLSLDFLFTGNGPENRGDLIPERELSAALRAYLVNALQRRGVPVDSPPLHGKSSKRKRAIDPGWSSRPLTDVLRKGEALLRDVVRSMEERVLQDLGSGVALSYSVGRRPTKLPAAG